MKHVWAVRFGRVISVVAGALSASACSADRRADSSERVGTISAQLNASPATSNFVLYAQRSLRLGAGDNVTGGDIGVRAQAVSSFGTQLQIGNGSSVQPIHNVLAPSVSLGLLATVGDVQAGTLQNNGGILHTLSAFPASAMPPLPATPPSGPGGNNVTVPAFTIATLNPGDYGALNLVGTLSLNPGKYTFTNVIVANSGHLWAQPGGVDLRVATTFTAGQWATISPVLGQAANDLQISVAGSDVNGAAAASIGAYAGVDALFAVPHGTLSLASHVGVTGAFAASDITVGDAVTAAFQSGFANPPHGQQQLGGYVNPPRFSGTLVGPVPGGTTLALALGLSVKNPQALQTFIQGVSDPTSATFRQYLSAAQFTATYSPSTSDYQTLTAFAQSNGLTVAATHGDRLLLDVTGSASSIENAFHVNLNVYQRADGTQFYALDQEPSVDLSVPLLHVSGLDNYFVPRRLSGTGPVEVGMATYNSHDLRNAYASCVPANGSGQTVGLVEFEDYADTDIAGYEQKIPGNPQPQVKRITVGSSPGVSGFEATGDIELAIGMAPGLAGVAVFEGLNPNSGANNTYVNTYADSMMSTLADPTYSYINQFSSSWWFFWDDNIQTALDTLAARGQSFFQSSGDFGLYSPGEEHLVIGDHVTIVGGTTLTMNGGGAAWAGETTWQTSTLRTSGGIECCMNKVVNSAWSGIPIPSWQSSTSMATNGGSTQYRNSPDVSIVATNLEIFYQGIDQSFMGTSAAAPLWAGFAALVNQQLKASGQTKSDGTPKTVGFPNPALYQISQNAALYAASFNDINDGSKMTSSGGVVELASGQSSDPNASFTAVNGYDLATGLGTPKCFLADQLASPAPSQCACGTCVDLLTDPNNCGSCGNSCQGGTCSAGTCTSQCVPGSTRCCDATSCGTFAEDTGPNTVFTQTCGSDQAWHTTTTCEICQAGGQSICTMCGGVASCNVGNNGIPGCACP
jgi:hypothetical protein